MNKNIILLYLEKGSVQIYPFKKIDLSGPRRTNENFNYHRKKAIKRLNTAKKIKSYKGVKGSTVLSKCSFYSVCDSTQIDYMHSIGLGLIKNLFQYWFDEKLGDYSLRYYYDKIEQRYLSIRPPSYIPNSPRSITEWNTWKANEFISFILFYALPTFHGLMNIDHFEHLTKLVVALEILLCKIIRREDLKIAQDLLNDFVANAATLYSLNIMKSGMHDLLHLVECTIEIGPLNAFSLFPFE